jgi:hypothetical protein
MFRFFRQLRQRLLTENKFSKYLLYAVGEILLVVVGILIALQVDSWNETRSENREETAILKSLKTDFLQSKINVDHTLEDQTRVVRYCARLFEVLSEGDTRVPPDSLGEFIYQGALSYWRMEPANGTYDALIGSGRLSLIKSKTLSRLLAEYSAELKYGFEDELQSTDLTTLLVEKSSSFAPVLGKSVFATHFLTTRRQFTDEEIQEALEALQSDNSFLGVLAMKYALEDNRLKYQQKVSKYIADILVLLEEELRKKGL